MKQHKYSKGGEMATKKKFSKGGGVESKGKTKGSMVKGVRRFAEGGMTDAEQEAMDKAAGLEESNKEPSTGFFERLKAGNIDDPKSEAYKRFGAGRGAASRAARVPVEDAVPVKVNRMPEMAMGEDERPAPTGMGAATKMLPAQPVKRPTVKPQVKAPPPRPAPTAKPVARPAPVVPVNPEAAPIVDELAEYAASKKKPASKAETTTTAEDRMFTPPSKEDIDKGMEAATMILGPGAGLKALQALAKKLAARGSSGSSMGQMVSTKLGKSSSSAPYLKELGNSPRKIGSETKQIGMKAGGKVKKVGNVSSKKASSVFKRGDGIATKGKTRGKMV
jgi:hypothetical protein